MIFGGFLGVRYHIYIYMYIYIVGIVYKHTRTWMVEHYCTHLERSNAYDSMTHAHFELKRTFWKQMNITL